MDETCRQSAVNGRERPLPHPATCPRRGFAAFLWSLVAFPADCGRFLPVSSGRTVSTTIQLQPTSLETDTKCPVLLAIWRARRRAAAWFARIPVGVLPTRPYA